MKQVFLICNVFLSQSITLYVFLYFFTYKILFHKYKMRFYQVYFKYKSLARGLKVLVDENCWYLYGSSNKSLIVYYRNTGSIGIISLKNWCVTDFRIEKSEERMDSGTSSTLTSADCIAIPTEGISDRGTASIEVDLSEDCEVEYKMLKANLCQSCLDKIISGLEYSKW